MINSTKLGAFCLLIVLSGASASTVFGAEGGDVDNGGEHFAAHFAGVAGRITQALDLVCQSKTESICDGLESFRNSLSAPVVPVDGPLGTETEPKTATNDGHTIFLSLPKYKSLLTKGTEVSAMKVVGIVAHEFATIAGLEASDTYNWSSQISPLTSSYMISQIKIAAVDLIPSTTELFESEQTYKCRFNDSGLCSKAYLCDEAYEAARETAESRCWASPRDFKDCSYQGSELISKNPFHCTYKAMVKGFPNLTTKIFRERDLSEKTAEREALVACVEYGFEPEECEVISRDNGSCGLFWDCWDTVVVRGRRK